MLTFMLFCTNVFYGIIAWDRMKLTIQIFDFVFFLCFITQLSPKTELFFFQDKKSNGVIYFLLVVFFSAIGREKLGIPTFMFLMLRE